MTLPDYEPTRMVMFITSQSMIWTSEDVEMERKTFRRTIRDRHLTETELVADDPIGSQVIQEFPPCFSFSVW